MSKNGATLTPVRVLLMGVALMAFSLGTLPSARAGGQEQVQSDPASQATNRGPFSLINHNGQPVTDQDFLGRFLLVFFGYTHCPDVCPTDLQIMSQALDGLGRPARTGRRSSSPSIPNATRLKCWRSMYAISIRA
ncbi:MAG: hypothetical protein COA65_06020 [Rhodospirillaceae bacterium]|nr:MAG: hypothetical protein COA65_06020 [Rhodospirillaceae bacterium]